MGLCIVFIRLVKIITMSLTVVFQFHRRRENPENPELHISLLEKGGSKWREWTENKILGKMIFCIKYMYLSITSCLKFVKKIK